MHAFLAFLVHSSSFFQILSLFFNYVIANAVSHVGPQNKSTQDNLHYIALSVYPSLSFAFLRNMLTHTNKSCTHTHIHSHSHTHTHTISPLATLSSFVFPILLPQVTSMTWTRPDSPVWCHYYSKHIICLLCFQWNTGCTQPYTGAKRGMTYIHPRITKCFAPCSQCSA